MLTHQSLTERVIGLAINVHKELGPGMLGSVYETSLDERMAGRAAVQLQHCPAEGWPASPCPQPPRRGLNQSTSTALPITLRSITACNASAACANGKRCEMR